MSCSSMPSASSPSLWASLPDDLLELILGSLQSFFDQLRFGAVCKSWRDAAATFMGSPGLRRLCSPALPVLTFCDPGRQGEGEADDPDEEEGGEGEGEDDDEAPTIVRCFYSLSEDKVYRHEVPGESRYWRCIGSSHGWLAMVDLCAKPILFNPFSGARVDLPSFVTLSRIITSVERREEDGATVYTHYCDPSSGTTRSFTGKEMRDHFAVKLVLSSSPLDSSCVAMATVYWDKLLVYTRPGDDSWVEVQPPTEMKYFRNILYHDRRFYALNRTGEILAIHFKDPELHLPGCNRSHLRPNVELIAPMRDAPSFDEDGPRFDEEDNMYLAVLPSGEFIYIVRYLTDDRIYKTEAFDVYKLVVNSKGKEWVEMDGIGDCCLFLGFNHTMVLPASQVLGKHRANCIFFTDDTHILYYGEGHDYGGHDLGVYDIEEATTEPFYHIDAPRLMPPPMWITSDI